MEIGIYTFADLAPDHATAGGVGPRERLRNLMEEIELADQVGLDVVGIGEHHRPDFAVSAPAVVLAAAAEHTTRIRLTSAVPPKRSHASSKTGMKFQTTRLN